MLVVKVLVLVAAMDRAQLDADLYLCFAPVDRLSIAHKPWLSRVLLQIVWRRRRVRGSTEILHVPWMEMAYGLFAVDGEQMPDILRTNLFLISAISLGLQTDIRDLYAPNNRCVTFPFSPSTPLIEQQRYIEDGDRPFPPAIATDHHGGDG